MQCYNPYLGRCPWLTCLGPFRASGVSMDLGGKPELRIGLRRTLRHGLTPFAPKGRNMPAWGTAPGLNCQSALVNFRPHNNRVPITIPPGPAQQSGIGHDPLGQHNNRFSITIPPGPAQQPGFDHDPWARTTIRYRSRSRARDRDSVLSIR